MIFQQWGLLGTLNFFSDDLTNELVLLFFFAVYNISATASTRVTGPVSSRSLLSTMKQ
jgi:hypothetical protein